MLRNTRSKLRDRSLIKDREGGGAGGKSGGCQNNLWLEGGLSKFFQHEGGGVVKIICGNY